MRLEGQSRGVRCMASNCLKYDALHLHDTASRMPLHVHVSRCWANWSYSYSASQVEQHWCWPACLLTVLLVQYCKRCMHACLPYIHIGLHHAKPIDIS